MINIYINVCGNFINKVDVSGHATANCSDINGKLVCSAVSSAVIMAANTISEVVCDENALITNNDNAIYINIKQHNNSTEAVLQGLMLHLDGLFKLYSSKLYMEVSYNDKN